MSRLSANMALVAMSLACAGCQNQALTTVSSLTTSAASLASGTQTPKSEFGINEIVLVYVYVTWPDVTAPGGTHEVDWRWYRDAQLISEHHGHVRFNTAPGDVWTRRPAAGLGPGNYRVETRVDDQLMATNNFKVDAAPVSSAYDKQVAENTCKFRPDPNPSQTPLQPLEVGRPEYPAGAALTGVPGCAVVLMEIDENGRSRQPVLVAEYPHGLGFGAAALMAAASYRYASGHGGYQHYLTVHFEYGDAGHG